MPDFVDRKMFEFITTRKLRKNSGNSCGYVAENGDGGNYCLFLPTATFYANAHHVSRSRTKEILVKLRLKLV